MTVMTHNKLKTLIQPTVKCKMSGCWNLFLIKILRKGLDQVK